MTWEEHASGKPEQLSFPAFTTIPTVAERAFVRLASRWHELALSVPGSSPLPRDADNLALSCLMLAVEHGQSFADVANHQISANTDIARSRGYGSWPDELLWKLCALPGSGVPPREARPVELLAQGLGNGLSSTRCWLMEIAWIVRSWLAPEAALGPLLNNVADTLGGWDMAAGLASALTATEDEFWRRAREFVPRAGFEEQFENRLKYLEAHGTLEAQAIFWKREAGYRKALEESVLGLRIGSS